MQFTDFSYPPPDGFDSIMFEKSILYVGTKETTYTPGPSTMTLLLGILPLFYTHNMNKNTFNISLTILTVLLLLNLSTTNLLLCYIEPLLCYIWLCSKGGDGVWV